MTDKHQRKTLIVDRKLQYTLMAYMVGIASMSSVVTALTARFIAELQGGYGPSILVTATFLAALILISGWMALTLLFTNRVFGPIYRLHREIKNWKSGESVQKIILRKGDHLTELIDDFNELAAKTTR